MEGELVFHHFQFFGIAGQKLLFGLQFDSCAKFDAIGLTDDHIAVAQDATAVGIPAQIVRIAGKATSYADEVDQINVKDPILEKLAAVSSRLELVEKLLDDQYMNMKNNPQERPVEVEE